MRSVFRYLVSSFSIVLILFSNAIVTRADVTGSIQGVVRDRSQGAVAGAQLEIVNTETNLRYQVTSGQDGSYRVLALPVGTYKLTVNAKGFRPFAETDIVVKVNDQLQIDVTLDVGSAQQKSSTSPPMRFRCKRKAPSSAT